MQPQGIGQMTIQHSVPQGGTFTSTLPVSAMFVFTRIDDSSTRSRLFTDSLTQPSCTWSDTPPNGILPSTNDFFPGGQPGNPSVLNHVLYHGGRLHLDLALTSDVPEPSMIVMGGTGSLLLLAHGLRTRRKRQKTLGSIGIGITSWRSRAV